MEELNKIMRDIFLSKSHVISSFSIRPEVEECANYDVKEYINYEINRGILDQIDKITAPAVLYSENLYEKVYRKELFICAPEVLKCIVNNCIQHLSDEQIKNIKDGRDI
jgi:hypothetical protein